jgi:hypothetical protein
MLQCYFTVSEMINHMHVTVKEVGGVYEVR